MKPEFFPPSDSRPTPERNLGRKMVSDAVDASSRAKVATTKALRDRSHESHQAASEAHTLAAELMGEVPGYSDASRRHREDAEYHRKRARDT